MVWIVSGGGELVPYKERELGCGWLTGPPNKRWPKKGSVINNSVTELDVESILSNIHEVAITVGEEWLTKNVKKEKEKQQQDKKNINNRKHSYLYTAKPHPLVEWTIEVEHWRHACIRTSRFELNESILKYSILGKALERVRGLKGFEKLEPRLKMKAEFYSAAFEAEVASSYVSRGWEVEFVEEGNNRSPDLKVTREDGSVFLQSVSAEMY